MEVAKKIRPLVYIVDDDIDILNFLERKLIDVGIEVKCFHQVDHFIKEFALKCPDLCIVDLNIDNRLDMGLKILAFLKEKISLSLPIILMSANDQETTLKMAKELKADNFISKPFDLDLLYNKLYLFIDTPLLEPFSPYRGRVPQIFSPIFFEGEFHLIEVNEVGLILNSNYFVNTETAIRFNSDLIQEMTMEDELVFLTGKAEKMENGQWKFMAKFDQSKPDILRNVRRWLFHKKFGRP